MPTGSLARAVRVMSINPLVRAIRVMPIGRHAHWSISESYKSHAHWSIRVIKSHAQPCAHMLSLPPCILITNLNEDCVYAERPICESWKPISLPAGNYSEK